MKKKVLVKTAAIDDDADILQYVHDSIVNANDKQIGFEITTFSDSVELWNDVQKKSYDLIITDWKMPHLSGLGLLNRIKMLEQYQFIPVVIITGFLETKDFRLLDEFPFVALVEKPFTAGKLTNNVLALIHQVEKFKKQVGVLDQLLAVEELDFGQIEKTCETLLEQSRSQIRTVLYIARRATNMGHQEFALRLYELILTHDNTCIQALTELGKDALRNHDMEKAKTLLFQAQVRSPQNLERLCMLGQAELENISPDQALNHFKEALAIDPSSKKAKDGLKLTETLKEITTQNSLGIDITGNFASMMNAVGIALARGGNPKGGIEHYISALNYAMTPNAKARLAFNIGLSYMREKKANEGASWFEMATRLDPTYDRAKEYYEKVRNAEGVVPLPIGSEDYFNNIEIETEEDLIKKKIG